EAADVYARVGGSEAEREARVCAHKIMDVIAALRAHPQDRLFLLIARYERQMQQLALEADTQERQAECAVHIARIFQRRERPQAAVARYEEALALYAD